MRRVLKFHQARYCFKIKYANGTNQGINIIILHRKLVYDLFQASALAMSQPRTFHVNGTGKLNLVSRSVLLKFHVEKQHFSESGTMEVQCMASTATVKAPPLVTTLISTLYGHRHNSLLSNQKLEWPSSAGESSLPFFRL